MGNGPYEGYRSCHVLSKSYSLVAPALFIAL